VEAKEWLPWNWFRKKSLGRTALINAATAYARTQGYSVDKDYVITSARGRTGKVIRLFPGA
jgi:hypothetical protein